MAFVRRATSPVSYILETYPTPICEGCWHGHEEMCLNDVDPKGKCGCTCWGDVAYAVGLAPLAPSRDFAIAHGYSAKWGMRASFSWWLE